MKKLHVHGLHGDNLPMVLGSLIELDKRAVLTARPVGETIAIDCEFSRPVDDDELKAVGLQVGASPGKVRSAWPLSVTT